MKGLYWSFILTLAAFIIYVRFHRETDEYCDFCGKGIDMRRDNFVSAKYAIDTGLLRAFDYWHFCGDECHIMFLDLLATDTDTSEG